MKKTLFQIQVTVYVCATNTETKALFAWWAAWCSILPLAGGTESGSPRSWPSYISTLRDKENDLSDRWGTHSTSSFLFRWLASCRRAPQAKWHQLRTKREIAGWEAKAFTDPLKICKRIPSRGITCKKYNRRWESISSIIHDIYASCFNAYILRDTFSIVGNNNNYRDICLWFSTHTFGKVLSLIPFKTEEKCQR